MTNAIPVVVPRRDRLKRCTGPCAQWLPVDCFSRDIGNPDQLRNECCACRSERRGELERGASRCKPWRRKGLRKAEQ